MKQVLIDQLNRLPNPSVVAIGKYDGLHLGQRAVLERLNQRAAELECESVVMTFDPHPMEVLRPAEAPTLLTTKEQKLKLLSDAGVGCVVVVPFTLEFAETPAEQFVRDLLIERLGTRSVFVGSKFRFGRAREGDLVMLKQLAEELGFTVEGVPEVEWLSEPVSSSRIRRALRQGELRLANEMLGRPYAVRGKVVRGKGIGRELGWPTLNLETQNELLPPDGVYVTRTQLSPGQSTTDTGALESTQAVGSITNIGTRPTLHRDSPRVVEAHLLEYSGDAYGEDVEVELLHYIRPERRFPDREALVEQIAKDVTTAREYLSTGVC